MGSAFVFDLMTIIGKALDSLVKNGQWKEVNYTDCYKFTSTDIVAWTQATKFKQQILEVYIISFTSQHFTKIIIQE